MVLEPNNPPDFGASVDAGVAAAGGAAPNRPVFGAAVVAAGAAKEAVVVGVAAEKRLPAGFDAAGPDAAALPNKPPPPVAAGPVVDAGVVEAGVPPIPPNKPVLGAAAAVVSGVVEVVGVPNIPPAVVTGLLPNRFGFEASAVAVGGAPAGVVDLKENVGFAGVLVWPCVLLAPNREVVPCGVAEIQLVILQKRSSGHRQLTLGPSDSRRTAARETARGRGSRGCGVEEARRGWLRTGRASK